jgi:hypothetical protein
VCQLWKCFLPAQPMLAVQVLWQVGKLCAPLAPALCLLQCYGHMPDPQCGSLWHSARGRAAGSALQCVSPAGDGLLSCQCAARPWWAPVCTATPSCALSLLATQLQYTSWYVTHLGMSHQSVCHTCVQRELQRLRWVEVGRWFVGAACCCCGCGCVSCVGPPCQPTSGQRACRGLHHSRGQQVATMESCLWAAAADPCTLCFFGSQSSS